MPLSCQEYADDLIRVSRWSTSDLLAILILASLALSCRMVLHPMIGRVYEDGVRWSDAVLLDVLLELQTRTRQAIFARRSA